MAVAEMEGLGMERDPVQSAMRSIDPIAIESAIREIDVEINVLEDDDIRKGHLILDKAILCGKLGHFEEARKQLFIASEKASLDPDIQLQVEYISALFYDEEDKTKEAFAQLTSTLTKHADRLAQPDAKSMYEDIQCRRAFESFELRNFQEAVALFNECLSFELSQDARSNVLAGLGISHSWLKNRDAARNYLIQSLNLGPTGDWAAEAHFYLGLTYAHLKLLRESKTEFERCETLHPSALVYAWLSKICELLGEKAEAQRYAILVRLT